ncbi:hypothetical protein AB0B28_02435 [Glycomyces sp. NPDC046736]|uniref:hypothetical protein n=1 Tax=Glycomyces sp. NPDC046736 TaxID=3155615 RepID=UPI0033F9412E
MNAPSNSAAGSGSALAPDRRFKHLGTAIVVEVVAGVVIAILSLKLGLDPGADTDVKDSPSSTPTTSGIGVESTEPRDESEPDDESERESHSESESESESEPEPEPHVLADVSVGECVTADGDDYYFPAYCDVGNFLVLERLQGKDDSAYCSEWEFYNGSLSFHEYPDSPPVLLCMRMQYPDDIGYAQTDHCLYASGPDDDMTFEFADCAYSNVYVVGRTTGRDTSFCDGYGWATWQNAVFTEYSYTVCFAWL